MILAFYVNYIHSFLGERRLIWCEVYDTDFLYVIQNVGFAVWSIPKSSLVV